MDILLASDDVVSRQAVQVVLRKYGHVPRLVATAEDVISALGAEGIPDLVILDSRLLSPNPETVFDRIFSNSASGQTRLFLLTHHQHTDESTSQISMTSRSFTTGGLGDLDGEFRNLGPSKLLDPLVHPDELKLTSEDEFLAAFLHSPIPIYLVNEDEQVVRANRVKNPHIGHAGEKSRGLGHMLGCLHVNENGKCNLTPECPDCPLRQVIRETLRLNRFFHRKEVRFQMMVHDQPRDVYFLASTIPLWIEQKKMILLYLEDISELRQSQNLLEQFNHNLEEKVVNRTAEIRDLLEQKRAFIQQLGHDLRTPLTPFVGLLPLLRQRMKDPKGLEMLDVIINNAEYMHQLVAKTLDLLLLDTDSRPLEPHPVDLHVETSNILADFAHTLQDGDIAAENEIDASIKVHVDLLQFKELLLNILSNSVRFTESGGRITIDAHHEGNDVLVSIADTGIGMTPEQLPHVFEEFYKGDPSRHDRKSPGLGLAICQRIVEGHQGRIWAQSPGLGEGSTIFFTLPAQPLETTPTGEIQAKTGPNLVRDRQDPPQEGNEP